MKRETLVYLSSNQDQEVVLTPVRPLSFIVNAIENEINQPRKCLCIQ